MPHTPRLPDRLWPWWPSLLFPLAALLLLGQDCNWDLRNYHLYNPHAWLHGRYDIDIAPAQLQSWHNPLLDLPLHALDSLGASGLLVSLWLLLPAVLSLRLLIGLSDRLASGGNDPLRQTTVAAIAVAGAGALLEMGSSYNDWFVALGLLTALACLLRADATTRAWPLLLAGLAGGVTAGLKLTAAPYCLALAAACLLGTPGIGASRQAGRLGLLALGGLAGFALSYGHWGWFLHERYGNPFFPYFNQIFQSPQALPLSWADERFRPEGLSDLLAVPLRLLQPSTRYSERLLADPRLLLGLLALATLAWRQWRGGPAGADRGTLRALAAFFLLALLLWGAGSGVYRYLLPLEALCALLIAQALWSLPAGKARALAAGAAFAALAGLTHVQDLERQPFGASLSEMQGRPAVQRGEMVLILDQAPMAFVATYLPDQVPVIALSNFFMRPGSCTSLQVEAERRVRAHRGPAWLLGPSREPDASPGSHLDHFGLALRGECRDVASRYGMLYLCPLDTSALRTPCAP
jgi:hypothetical protein